MAPRQQKSPDHDGRGSLQSGLLAAPKLPQVAPVEVLIKLDGTVVPYVPKPYTGSRTCTVTLTGRTFPDRTP